jgi:hypothetical protein
MEVTLVKSFTVLPTVGLPMIAASLLIGAGLQICMSDALHVNSQFKYVCCFWAA